MPVANNGGGYSWFGNRDPKISQHLKCVISNPGTASIAALVGEGSSLEMQANWESPFEADSIGSMHGRIAGLVQLGTGNTPLTTLQSAQVWQGNRPVALNLVLHFYCISNPKSEVEEPLKILKMMASPDTNQFFPIGWGGTLGQAPTYSTISVGRNFIWDKCVIESISEPYDTKRDSSGSRLNAVVNVSASTSRMVNRPEIPGMSGG